jgi:uncharacterized protein YdaU (DUF1376 family)
MAKKKTKPDIWMPLYIADYLSDTMHLNAEQHGAYLLLIMAAWKHDGQLPSEASALRQISRMTPQQWAKSETVLQRFFFVTEDFWIHNRVRTELERARANVEKQSKAGAAGAAKRWGLKPDQLANA